MKHVWRVVLAVLILGTVSAVVACGSDPPPIIRPGEEKAVDGGQITDGVPADLAEAVAPAVLAVRRE